MGKGRSRIRRDFLDEVGARPLFLAAILFGAGVVSGIALAVLHVDDPAGPPSFLPFAASAVSTGLLAWAASRRFTAISLLLAAFCTFSTGLALALHQAGTGDVRSLGDLKGLLLEGTRDGGGVESAQASPSEGKSDADDGRSPGTIDSQELDSSGPSAAPASSVSVLLEGMAVSTPSVRDGKTRLLLRVRRVQRSQGMAGPTHSLWRKADFTLRASVQGEPRIFQGDRILARAWVRAIQGPSNPGESDFRKAMAPRGVRLSASVEKGGFVLLNPQPVATAFFSRHRERFARVAQGVMSSEDAARLVRALGLGDREGMEGSELVENFRASGLAHLFCVSGLHVGVVAMSLYRLLRRLLSRFPAMALRVEVGRIAALAALPATWLYVAMTGGAVPSVRAAVMASCLFASRALWKDSDSVSSLSLAAVLVLAADPSAVATVTFQLSFAAAIGLMAFGLPVLEFLPGLPAGSSRARNHEERPETEGEDDGAADLSDSSNRAAVPEAGAEGSSSERAERISDRILHSERTAALLRGAREASATTIAATIATAPLVALSFRQASLVAVLANVVALPLGSLLTALAALAAVSLFLGDAPAAAILALASPLANLLVVLVDALASLPLASVEMAPPPVPLILSFYAAAFAFLSFWRGAPDRSWRLFALAAVLAAFPTGAPSFHRTETGEDRAADDRGWMRVAFLSVGQGDSALATLPGGRHVLVDGGGDLEGRDGWRVGERVVVPALKAMGVRRLDAVVMTHPHPDHALGLLDVVQSIPVREIWMSDAEVGADGKPRGEGLSKALLDAAGRHQSPPPTVRGFHRGMTAAIGGAAFQFVHPPPHPGGFTENDGSLAFRLSYGSRSFLFAGDMEGKAEREVVGWSALTSSPLASDVLKVGHHGSPTSSSLDFLKAVSPAHASVSCGVDNRFGFPAPSVLRRLEGVGAHVHRTDRDGAVLFFTDGDSLEVVKPYARKR